MPSGMNSHRLFTSRFKILSQNKFAIYQILTVPKRDLNLVSCYDASHRTTNDQHNITVLNWGVAKNFVTLRRAVR
jgi:hypothetical protein